MIESILITTSQTAVDKQALTKFYPNKFAQHICSNNWQCYYRLGQSEETANIAEEANDILILVGKIHNINFLQRLLLPKHRDIYQLTSAQCLLRAYQEFSTQALTWLSGNFSIIIISDNHLYLITDPFGHMPCFYCEDSQKQLWITSEVKSLISLPSLGLSLKPVSTFSYGLKLDEDFCLFKNIKKVPVASIVEFSCSTGKKNNITIKKYHELDYQNTQFLEKTKALSFINDCLHDAIIDGINISQPVAVPLSGGLDSSLIASLLSHLNGSVHSISIGTEQANEFQYAKIVSDFIHSEHRTITISQKDFLSGLIQTCFYNEIFDGLCAEIQSPIALIYEALSGKFNQVATGFGADMFFGGHLSVSTPTDEVNVLLWNNLSRIRWTGEYSPFLAQYRNLYVNHPFCDYRFVQLVCALDPQLKVSQYENKHILREFARKHNYLPITIANRNKIAIEQASQLHRQFSDYLEQESCFGYERKNQFTYDIFYKLFIEKYSITELIQTLEPSIA